MITFTKIKAKDAFSYRNQEFTFQNGLHSVSGLNGSSKTSLFLLLQQACYNRNAKGGKLEDVNCLITNEPYEIEVEFTKGKDSYKIINSRKQGKILLYKNDKDISLRKIPEVLKQIEEILGADYELFRDLTYQSKNSSLDILDSTTNKGRALFVNNILKLEELDQQLSKLNDRRKQLEGKNGRIAALQDTINSLELSLAEEVTVDAEVEEVSADVIANLDGAIAETQNKLAEMKQELVAATKQQQAVEDYSAAVAQLETKKRLATITGITLDEAEESDKLDDLEDEISDIKQKLAKLEVTLKQAEQSERLLAKREKLEEELAKCVTPDKPLTECQDQLAKINKAWATKTEQIRSKDTEIKKLEKASTLGICPTCTSVVDPQHFTKPIEGLRSEIAELVAFCEKCENSVAKYNDRISVWTKINNLSTEIEKISNVCTINSEELAQLYHQQRVWNKELDQMQNDKAIRVQQLTQYRKQEAAKQEIALMEAKLGPTPDTPECSTEQLQAALDDLTAEHKAFRFEKAETESILREQQKHNAQVRACKALNEQVKAANTATNLLIDQKKKELASLQLKVDHLKNWVNILGPKGYRTIAVARFLNALNKTMKKYADLMCDGKIVCTFALSDTGEITFEITDEAKTQDIALWSGGETARIKIVCLFAVLEMLESMGSVAFNVLCLDEIFSALDQEGKEGLFKVLEYLKQKNKALYVIAHEELALDMMYDSVIKAEKLHDGTTRIIQ